MHALPSRGRRGRPPGLPKVPGSGRKSGSSNKVTKPVREIAAAYTEEAIHAIATLARNASNEGVRLRAWQELLDRGHGRPAQEVRGDVTVAQEDAPVDIVELARDIAWIFARADRQIGGGDDGMTRDEPSLLAPTVARTLP